jgi:DNA-binding response OmpR family regulator
MNDDQPTILVVDDERQLADLYAAWLRDDYDVLTAYGGDEAVEMISEDVDVALVDRLMPRIPGDDVVEYVRERGYDCRVSIVTAVEPDFDIIEMGFDEYLVKPVENEALQTVVRSLVTRSEYDEKLQALFALAAKRATLEAKKGPHELETSDAYAELTAAFEELQGDLDRTITELSGRDFEVEMRRMGVDAD